MQLSYSSTRARSPLPLLVIKLLVYATIDFNGSGVDSDVENCSDVAFYVKYDGGDFKLRISAIINESAVMIEGSRAFLREDLQSKCSGGLSSLVNVKKYS